MKKVVIDTNVLIDALADKSSFSGRILKLAGQGEIDFFVSDKILREYELIVGREVKSDDDQADIENFIMKLNRVEIKRRVTAVKSDHEDDKFLEAALAAGADIIISSDAHLLELQQFEGIRLLKPKDFWYEFQARQDPSGVNEWAGLFNNLFS